LSVLGETLTVLRAGNSAKYVPWRWWFYLAK